jgi:hypothetical protein
MTTRAREQAETNEVALQWLRDNDWKHLQYTRRLKRETLTDAQETEYLTFLDEADAKAQEIA